MKFLFDLLPVLLFFVVFKIAGGRPEAATALANAHLGFLVAGGVVTQAVAPILLATLTAIAVTLAQVGWQLARGQRVDKLVWLSLAVVLVLGGATIWFHNEAFIKWKPTVLYWLMALALWLGQVFGRRSPLKAMLGEQLTLPDAVWRRLTLMWIAFFGLMGCANLYVADHFSTETWVDFKLFGGIGLMLAFTIAQGFYLSRHLQEPHE